MTPVSSASARMLRISSSVCMTTPVGEDRMPSGRRMALAEVCRTQTSGATSRCTQMIGMADRDRNALGLLERDRLWNELADHDAQVGDDREGEDERDRHCEVGLEEVTEEALADRAEQDAQSRYANLDDADEAHRVLHQLERGRGATAPALGALLQTGASRRDERVLRDHEEAVPCDQQENDDDSERVAHAPSAGRGYWECPRPP